jgi:hypothetical protein
MLSASIVVQWRWIELKMKINYLAGEEIFRPKIIRNIIFFEPKSGRYVEASGEVCYATPR